MAMGKEERDELFAITSDFLELNGIQTGMESPDEFVIHRNALVKNAIITLFKKDWATQLVTSRFVDYAFEGLNVGVNLMGDKAIEKQKEAQLSQLGWYVNGSKVELKPDKLDSVAVIVCKAALTGAVPDNPSDVRMNAFRYFDVLNMILGPNINFEKLMLLDDDTDAFTRFIRLKYFKFIVSQLKQFVKVHSYDELVTALYTMPFYQFGCCLAAAFRVKEQSEDWSQVRVGYPVLEIRNWNENSLNDLLTKTYVNETCEWLKLVPLINDERQFLNSSIAGAEIVLPISDTKLEDPFTLRHYKLFNVSPAFNFVIRDLYDDNDAIYELIPMNQVAFNSSYPTSYNVSVKGYYLAENNLPQDQTLHKLYVDIVHPFVWSAIKSSLDANTMYLYSVTREAELSATLDKVSYIMEQASVEMFTSVYSYTARRIVLERMLKQDGKAMPLFFSIDPVEGVVYTTESDE